jgi:N6-L-threonylcarbamoyladenine synthase
MRVLGIETSCDETGVALVEDGRRVLAEELATQVDLHAVFGGVVPEIASRQHVRTLYPLVRRVLEKAEVRGEQDVDLIAATIGPGLMGSLLVGASFARALAYAWNKPFVPVHHIEGHIFSVFLGEHAPEFPFLALIVSGGHTQIIHCEAPHVYTLVAQTRDDAVGESFDKVARLLGLPYPGGPSIQKAAQGGSPFAFIFPRAFADSDEMAFSYSGLKTAVRYLLRDRGGDVADIAASFQAAAIDVLIIKVRQALARYGIDRLVVAGGVAANKLLRERLSELEGVQVFAAPLRYCVDNGAMIAAAAYYRWVHGCAWASDTPVHPNLPLFHNS